MTQIPMTLQGHARLQKELQHLKTVERTAIIQAIAAARMLGDLSENGEYHAAREKQSFIESRISELEQKLANARVIDPSKLTGNTVKFGAKVELKEEETGKIVAYQIVGADESDVKEKRVSIASPLARALIGKHLGDVVEVTTPTGEKEYQILSVSFQ